MTPRATSLRTRAAAACAGVALAALAALPAAGQGPAAAPESRSPAISGRVVGDSGRPLRTAYVYAFTLGRGATEPRSARVDAEGKFILDGLAPGAYSLEAYAPGFVADRSSRGAPHFTGESVTIRLAKGGVITGRVTDADDRPVVGVDVRAIAVRDAEGEPIAAAEQRGADATDDEGVYRIFGLDSGAYVVAAGGPNWYGFSPSSAFGAEAPTYYPSATRAAATEVSVRAGDEAVGIDIRYRGETGHSVSGTVSGLDARADGSVKVILLSRSDGALVAGAVLTRGAADGAFRIDGVADGDYEIFASRVVRRVLARSPLRPLVMRGADVAGVRLGLEPFASVAGTVVVEPPLAPDPCPAATRRGVEESLATFDRVDAGLRRLPTDSGRYFSAPDAKGEFDSEALPAGRYRVGAVLPDPRWYLKAVTRAPGSGDIARDGLALAPGQRVTGFRAVVGYGASALTGRVMSADGKGEAPRGATVVLVPAEPERAEDALRYFEVGVDAGGAFALEHLPPGAYRVVVRVAATRAVVFAPDAAERTELRKLAEADGREVELLPCQRIENAVVTVAAATREK